MFDEAIKKLEEELTEIKKALARDIPNEINKAAQLGDFKENAEYHAAREKKRNFESRGAQIVERIKAMRSIDVTKIARDVAGLFSIVTLEDLNSGQTVTYELVVADLVDVPNGKISIAAPIGRAIMGKRVDDEFKVVLPSGPKEYMITKLQTIHDRKL